MKVKRSGFVYSLYRRNIIHLWILAAALLAIFLGMLATSHSYLMNYLFYRREPDLAQLTAFLEPNALELEDVCADIEKNGGEAALNRTRTSMFFLDNVYQEGSRYRFSLPMDPEKLTDTGIYYDDTYHAYTGITDRETVKAMVPREHYLTEHLYLYDYNGTQLLLVLSSDLDLELPEKESMRVTFAPMGIYSLYMAKDLRDAGYSGTINNILIDGRETPVDFEDDDFKDLVMILPFVLLTLIPSILFTVCPVLHPTYRQLDKFARTPQKAAEQVDRNYEEFGIVSRYKNTLFLEDWLVNQSFFKNGIEKNYQKQKD